jgi:DNA (cytosine-5)-methyltransferase 1
MSKLTVIDIFCGAGGFSEGFRQQGFEIVMGIDNWEPAIKTFNHNFNLDCKTKSVLEFEHSIEEIEALPDTDVILGSPPCVTFSSSNISGKADKTSGVTLTQIFLRIVAIKKWQKNSRLKAWYMENVPSSIKHLGKEYTFDELGLGEWAAKNKIGKSKIAIKLDGNQPIINSADYGCAQTRERVISGEIICKKKLVIPSKTNTDDKEIDLPKWKSLKEIRSALPKINCQPSSRLVSDPNYPSVRISLNTLTNHFYDTRLYKTEWKQTKFLKTNHPYMGKMSFPENESKPSRTVTATKIGTSREAIIYKSEYDRIGNGEFRTATVREAACIMGFPITYQFIGGETTKWRLVGNAVCPKVSMNFAKKLRQEIELPELRQLYLNETPNLDNVNDLNTFSRKTFKDPPKRNKGSRFRRHPFKDGNLTVTLSNYDISENGKEAGKWMTSIQYGSGEGFPCNLYPDDFFTKIEPIIRDFENGEKFLRVINNGFSDKVARHCKLQEMYELQHGVDNYLEPTELIDKVAEIISSYKFVDPNFEQNDDKIFIKKIVPKKQLLALYAINKICSIANG